MTLKFNSILIVTYGRSGSTLLQGLLNSIDGVVIRGENNNFIYSLYEAYKKLIEAKKHGLKKSAFLPTDSWYGSPLIEQESFISFSREVVKDIILSDLKNDKNVLVYGFKEIRYHQVEDLDGYLNFLSQVFPKVGFIFNTRNLNDVVKSAWWNNQDVKSVTNLLKNLECKFKLYLEKNTNNCFCITYEDVVNKTKNLRLLFDFLGADYIETKVDNVLFKKHSTTTKVKVDSSKRVIYSSNYSDFFKVLLIDHLPDKIVSETKFSFQGVAVPINNSIRVVSIKAIISDLQFNAVLGLKSSAYGNRYPEILSSFKSRFKIDNICMKFPEQIQVVAEVLCENEVQSINLATIEVKSVLNVK